ncbi:MAG: helicase-related protein [Pseudomonadota bacterium]
MSAFIPGQRWVSDNDTSLGLGIVKSTAGRTVEIEFPAADTTRTYAQLDAPLTRVIYAIGDTINSIDGAKLTVTEVENAGGTLRYHGTNASGDAGSMHECELDDQIAFNLPQDRLLAGQLDDNKWFELRAMSLRYRAQTQSSDTFGLQGARLSLIPHQLYIADEVSRRISPRVLLADEVGLGKTIEAGLVLHRMILSGRVRRSLIIVPDALLHQWLVELLRRFNLRFTLVDETHFMRDELSEDEADDALPLENPFDHNPLVLCGLSFACRDEIAPLISACEWDMLVVDEAHHLLWTPHEVSNEYRCVEQWAAQIDGVLLLTATPEQLGQEGHFARLRLLDPARFHSLPDYSKEQKSHIETARLVIDLESSETLAPATMTALNLRLGDNARVLNGSVVASNERKQAIGILVDQFGTGRMLFRNTRTNIQGFPARRLTRHELADDSSPTRIEWLANTIRDLAPEKLLLICARAETAMTIARQLREVHGLQASVFHEHMSLIERDRAAAWFADTEDGARILICSEIGSEGRNFQFLHHLVLFDIPDNPDLLEQRIGRLDRIGQTQDVVIHVPAFPGSRESRLANWYHEALNAFESSCVTGQFVKQSVGGDFEQYLTGSQDVEEFVSRCHAIHQDKVNELAEGRDRLLEINACNPAIADSIASEIEQREQDSTLSKYLERAFDCYGVDIDEHSLNNWIIRPSDHLQIDRYPEIPEDGITITTRRDIALNRDDMHFVTWEHPLVRATFDLSINGEKGSVSVCALKMPQLPARSVLMEALFETRCIAPQVLGVERFLPSTVVRLLVDQTGRNYSDKLAASRYASLLENVSDEVAKQMIDMTRTTLKKQIGAIEEIANSRIDDIRSDCIDHMHKKRDPELARLVALKQRNPAVRDAEIERMRDETASLEKYLGATTLSPSALRVIYTH